MPAYGHYEALSLERAALAKLAAGDRDSACILIDRAARISPHDRRIAADIGELEVKASFVQAPSKAAPKTITAIEMPPEPPALWKRR